MDSLRSLLPKVLKKRGIYHQVEAAAVTHAAEQWLQKELLGVAAHLSAEKFSEGMLFIRFSHGTAAQECRQILPRLHEYLRQRFGPQTVLEVRLERRRK